ncbi:NAD(P)-dependent oxidoreductase [Arthrobacter sp. 4R501]|uniref:NAD-dependent epimerase/dehydratase family protein n=1 Tax=Arthrobacter sp. 4R501 TaxID=2058886 RepID=UPI0015E3293A|nr:NAD(P)-dependent oxidoreductase [Arthrobacter sp. 4R501]
MRILVTGGSGFIGTNLVEVLKSNHDVRNFDHKMPQDRTHFQFWTEGSVDDYDALAAVYNDHQPEVVYHLAARTDLHGESIDDYPANTQGVRNIIAAGESLANRPHTVYASSRLVFAIDHVPTHDYDYKPTTPYGESKVQTELIIRDEADRGGTWTMVRPTSIWGPWFGIPYRDFFDTVERGRYVKTIGQNPNKSYGFVGNAVHELVQLAMAPTEKVHGKVFWLTDYPPIVLDEWADLIADEFRVRRPYSVPLWALRAAAKLGDAAKALGYREPPLTSFRLRNLLTDMNYDATSTQQIVGDLPYSTNEGVRLTVDWITQQRTTTKQPAEAVL